MQHRTYAVIVSCDDDVPMPSAEQIRRALYSSRSYPRGIMFAVSDETDNIQDLYNRFDGTGNANERLAWYGQCRAKGMTHVQAVRDTAEHYPMWCARFWPRRGIEPL